MNEHPPPTRNYLNVYCCEILVSCTLGINYMSCNSMLETSKTVFNLSRFLHSINTCENSSWRENQKKIPLIKAYLLFSFKIVILESNSTNSKNMRKSRDLVWVYDTCPCSCTARKFQRMFRKVIFQYSRKLESYSIHKNKKEKKEKQSYSNRKAQ